ncbi:immune-associated nucleotide-binding protein 9 [Tanacetum coccineum]
MCVAWNELWGDGQLHWDGQMLNVIDTPGLFDSTLDFDFIGKEIVNCINMAKDGIHAFLVVVSIRSRFSEDEKAAVSSLLTLFGRKIYDYMIVVFTGGDELDDDGESLEDFLRDSPRALKLKEAEAAKKEAEASKKKAEAAKKEAEAEKRKMKEKVEKAKKGQEELH